MSLNGEECLKNRYICNRGMNVTILRLVLASSRCPVGAELPYLSMERKVLSVKQVIGKEPHSVSMFLRDFVFSNVRWGRFA